MYKPVQLFSVSMYWLWIYDYILTFGDEVRYSSILRQRWQVLTIVQINYAWSGNRSWSEFISTPPKYQMIHGHPIVFALFIVVRHPEKDLKL